MSSPRDKVALSPVAILRTESKDTYGPQGLYANRRLLLKKTICGIVPPGLVHQGNTHFTSRCTGHALPSPFALCTFQSQSGASLNNGITMPTDNRAHKCQNFMNLSPKKCLCLFVQKCQGFLCLCQKNLDISKRNNPKIFDAFWGPCFTYSFSCKIQISIFPK